jgi:[acyl-carrier-protein] S-malonyltransferase
VPEICALIFPGQGSQNLKMLSKAKSLASFDKFYSVVREQLKTDIFSEVEAGGDGVINKNAVSSILTVFLSALHLEEFKKTNPMPSLFAGYSVGQWAAIYASGAISFDKLIHIVRNRAKIMDEWISKTKSGMLAVIGLMDDVVEGVCQEVRGQGQNVWISNFNAPAQYSLAGTLEGIQEAQALLQKKSPKKMAVLPVAGGWHSPLLEGAGKDFERFLEAEKISLHENQVIDNVTGDFLPSSKAALVTQLGRHLYCPVMWEKGVRRLISVQVKTFNEIGFGNMLTKYGFFIDRSLNHNPGLD